MPEKEYTVSLTDVDKLRVELITERGRIVRFVVQYIALIDSEWRELMRFDNWHGYPHRHTYYLHTKEYRVKLYTDDQTSFNQAKEYIEDHFKEIKANYLRRP